MTLFTVRLRLGRWSHQADGDRIYDRVYARGWCWTPIVIVQPRYQKSLDLRCATSQLQDMLTIQGQLGNWDYDNYMHGMYNGLEQALALLENREPDLKAAPKVWGKDSAAFIHGLPGFGAADLEGILFDDDYNEYGFPKHKAVQREKSNG